MENFEKYRDISKTKNKSLNKKGMISNRKSKKLIYPQGVGAEVGIG